MTYSRIVAFGEAMLRLTAAPGVPIETATSFAAPVGGAELNAALAARRSGLDAAWVSTLPAGQLGELVARHARASGVETILRRIDGARLGLYFLELATPPRSSQIIYDRLGSAFAVAPHPEVPWPDLLDPDTCLLVSGITPALGAEARRAVSEAVSAAREVGATVAADINYRAALWTTDEAFGWLKSVLDDIDILSAGTRDLERLGVGGPEPYATAVTHLGLQAVIGSTKHMSGRTAHIEVTASTGDESHTASGCASVVDPVGTGDAMFGTFLARFGRLPLEACTKQAMGATVACFGLVGDALTADPWTPDEKGDVRR